jgi:predicted nucleic acid-binding protein
MIKVYVFDTNSLISAHLLPLSVARKAFNKALHNGILVHSKETFSEFVEVFTRQKFDKYISLEDRLNAIKGLELKSQLVEVGNLSLLVGIPKTISF